MLTSINRVQPGGGLKAVMKRGTCPKVPVSRRRINFASGGTDLQSAGRRTLARLGVELGRMRHDRLERQGGLLELPEVGQRSLEFGDGVERLLHGVGRAQHLAVAAEAAD